MLYRLFSSCGEWGLLSSYGMQVSHCRGFSCWGAWALGCAGFSSFDSQVLVHACMLSHMQLFAPSWTVAHQAPLPMGFSRQEHWNGKKKKKEYWNGLPFLSTGDLPDSGIKPTSPTSPALQVDSLPLCHLGNLSQGFRAQTQYLCTGTGSVTWA